MHFYETNCLFTLNSMFISMREKNELSSSILGHRRWKWYYWWSCAYTIPLGRRRSEKSDQPTFWPTVFIYQTYLVVLNIRAMLKKQFNNEMDGLLAEIWSNSQCMLKSRLHDQFSWGFIVIGRAWRSPTRLMGTSLGWCKKHLLALPSFRISRPSQPPNTGSAAIPVVFIHKSCPSTFITWDSMTSFSATANATQLVEKKTLKI